MSEITLNPDQLKEILKNVIVELLSENREEVSNFLAEIIEDITIKRAIAEGENTELVSRDLIFKIIDEQGQLTLDHPLIADKNSRVKVIVLIPKETDIDDKSQTEVLADFRQAWYEAMTGKTIPIAQLWEGLEDD